MTADGHPEGDAQERPQENVRDTLFAADLKRLVRASQENNDEVITEVRERYPTK